MSGVFEDGQQRIVARANASLTDLAKWPLPVTLTRIANNSTLTTRLHVRRAAANRPFDTGRGPGTPIERNPTLEVRFQPGVIVRLGDHVTILAPHDDAGQMLEVIEPLQSRAQGTLATLAFVKGVR